MLTRDASIYWPIIGIGQIKWHHLAILHSYTVHIIA